MKKSELIKGKVYEYRGEELEFHSLGYDYLVFKPLKDNTIFLKEENGLVQIFQYALKNLKPAAMVSGKPIDWTERIEKVVSKNETHIPVYLQLSGRMPRDTSERKGMEIIDCFKSLQKPLTPRQKAVMKGRAMGMSHVFSGQSTKPETPYQTFKNLGFKRGELQDEVFFNKYGYNLFYMSKQIAPKTHLEWASDSEKVSLSVKGTIIAHLTIDEVVKFFNR